MNLSEKFVLGHPGLKYDADKPRMDLIDPYAEEQLAKVLTFGAEKYSPHNWRGGIQQSRLIAAARRHLNAFAKGENNDPETGLSHAAHLMCCAMFMVWMQKNRPSFDDRWSDISLAARLDTPLPQQCQGTQSPSSWGFQSTDPE